MKHRFPHSQPTKESAPRYDQAYVTKRNDGPSETVAQRRERREAEARAGWNAYVEQSNSVDENMMRLRKLRLDREAAGQQRQEGTDAGNQGEPGDLVVKKSRTTRGERDVGRHE
jgi:hypothetical protein